jgi:hypothetical protein
MLLLLLLLVLPLTQHKALLAPHGVATPTAACSNITPAAVRVSAM